MSVKLRGTVIISRTSGGDDDEPMHITIEDESSGCRVLEVYMGMEEFARALTSSFGKATIEHFTGAPVGKKHESKIELVPIEGYLNRDENKISAALKPFEVDGWKARRSDMTNGHCREGKGQRVVFHRYVEVPIATVAPKD